MQPSTGDSGTLNGPNGTKTAGFVTAVNDDGTLEVSLLRPGFETLTPVPNVVVGTGEGQWTPRT